MKKFFLFPVMALALASCHRADQQEQEIQEIPEKALACNKIYNSITTLNTFGTLIRTTCKPGPGIEAPLLTGNESAKNPLYIYRSSTASKVKTKAVHWWFYGTESKQLFKPTIYARVFVFDDGDSKVQQAKTQVQGGNHYLGFDRGVFQGVYPHAVINISHKINSNDKVQTTYNLENEIKRALPVGKRIFIQFVVQNSPTTPLPAGFATAKYAYCDFLNADDNAYPHYKIDLSDSNLGYQGKTFYYAN